jgi:DNA-binding CsgD family transcriptional regulator
MVRFLKRRGRPPYPDILTPSEWRVLEALRRGLTNTEIATELGLTVHGVKYHVSNMLGKLHLEGRDQLAAWRPEPSPKRTRAFLPLTAVKTGLATLGAVAAVAAVAIGAFIAFDRGNAEPTAGGLVASTGTAPASAANQPPDPHFNVDILSADALSTRLRLTFVFDPIIGDGHAIPRFAPGDLVVEPAGTGFNLAEQRGRMDIDRSGADGVVLTVEVGPLPANTTDLDVLVRQLPMERLPSTAAEILAVSGGSTAPTVFVVPGPFEAHVNIVPDPTVRDLTAFVPRTIDTGFGWAYVIDQVTATSAELAVTYHVEGDTSGLGSMPASPPGPSILFDAAATGGAPKVVRFPIASLSAISIRFGPGVRARELLSQATFRRLASGWAQASVVIDGAPYPVTLTGSGVAVSVTVDAPVVLMGPSTGGPETLADNLGSSYHLSGGSTKFPPGDSTWVFDAPVDPAATSLTFTLNGYAEVEQGDWSITIPIN